MLIFRARMVAWAYVSLVLMFLVGLLLQDAPTWLPQQLLVSLYKLSLVTLAAWFGYWIDRGLFPYARPDRFIQWGASPGAPGVVLAIGSAVAIAFAAAMLRRALIVAAAMLAVAVGA
jgi:hypothetical protein